MNNRIKLITVSIIASIASVVVIGSEIYRQRNKAEIWQPVPEEFIVTNAKDADDTNNFIDSGADEAIIQIAEMQGTEVISGSNNQMIENIISIHGQNVYYAYPKEFNLETPPILVVYSHGSNVVVTSNMSDTFMQDLHMWADNLTSHNYAFVASNQHGANWGSPESISDMEYAIEYMYDRFNLQERVMLVGFSMGGLPTLEFAFKNPTKVRKIALLAGTTYAYQYTKQQYLALRGIEIKIWHGTSDYNVPISMSRDFMKIARDYGVEVILVEEGGKTHWDMDLEYIDKVIDFYTNSN